MKDAKNLIMLTAIICFTGWFASNDYQLPKPVFHAFVIGIPIIYLIRIVLSRNTKYKKLFTSKFQWLFSKKHSEIILDLDVHNAFEFISNLAHENSKITLVNTDKRNNILLYSSKANWLTWGSSIYLSLSPIDDDKTNIVVDIVSFQTYNWGENEKVLELIKQTIQNQLVI
jgi:hypothetical protein